MIRSGNAVTVNLVASLISQDHHRLHLAVLRHIPRWHRHRRPDLQTAIGTGTLTFDTNGNLVNATNPTVTIDRADTGATPNLLFNLDFSASYAGSPNGSSSMRRHSRRGAQAGTLVLLSIDKSGIIKGTFTNGLTRTLGQIALATFRNDQGLVDAGNNTWQSGPNSGTAIITSSRTGFHRHHHLRRPRTFQRRSLRRIRQAHLRQHRLLRQLPRHHHQQSAPPGTPLRRPHLSSRFPFPCTVH